MGRYIDIDKMTEWTEVDQESCSRENCISANLDCNECFYNNGGAEDVVPVVHAKWEGIETIQLEVKDAQGIIINKNKIGFKFNHKIGLCSNCHSLQLISKYCIWCGAKMDKEDSHES